MGEFRAWHPGLFWGGVLLAGWGFLAGPLGLGTMFIGGWFVGLGIREISAYDLRPFPVGGGLEGQLRFWWCFAGAWTGTWLLAVVALGVAMVPGRPKPAAPARARAGWVAWLACAATSAVGATTLYPLRAAYFGAGAYPVASLRGLERAMDLRFPAGTQLIEAKGHGGWVGEFRAKVSMPRAAVKGFLSAPPFDPDFPASKQTEWSAWYQFEPLQGWHPEDVQEFVAAEGGKRLYGDSVYWWALADISHPETAIIYLEWQRA
jgi:hypothetical protein